MRPRDIKSNLRGQIHQRLVRNNVKLENGTQAQERLRDLSGCRCQRE